MSIYEAESPANNVKSKLQGNDSHSLLSMAADDNTLHDGSLLIYGKSCAMTAVGSPSL